MYEEDKRSRENSRNRDRNAPPVGRPNYYQVSTTSIWSYITYWKDLFFLVCTYFLILKPTVLRFKTCHDHFRQTRFRRWVNSNHRIQQNGITNGGQFLHGGNITLANFTTRKKCANSNLEVGILSQKIGYGKTLLHINHHNLFHTLLLRSALKNLHFL